MARRRLTIGTLPHRIGPVEIDPHRHHGCGLSFDVTTKSVLPVPHWLHRNCGA